MKGISGWLVAISLGEDEWKCTDQESGVQYVMIPGATEMLLLYADNWDTLQLVRSVLYLMYYCQFVHTLILRSY